MQLSDGRVIVVERKMLNQPGGDEWANNRAGVHKDSRIRFEELEVGEPKITWSSIKKSPQTWPDTPPRLDIEASNPVVYAAVHISPACEVYSKYCCEKGVWKEQPLPDRSVPFATNLLIAIGSDIPNFVTLQEKRVSNAELGCRRTLMRVRSLRKVCG